MFHSPLVPCDLLPWKLDKVSCKCCLSRSCKLKPNKEHHLSPFKSFLDIFVEILGNKYPLKKIVYVLEYLEFNTSVIFSILRSRKNLFHLTNPESYQSLNILLHYKGGNAN